MTKIKELVKEIRQIVFARESVVLVYSAMGLLCIHFLGNPHIFNSLKFDIYMHEGVTAELKLLGWWVLMNLIFYLILPVLIIRFYFKEKWVEYGLKLKKRGGNKIYFYFFLLMVPLVFLVSFSPSFQEKYPYYQLMQGEKLWPWFVIWEGLYFFSFFCLEFFFRGFMIHGLKPKFGINAIFVMTVPYCMIHFNKPMPEAIGSIFAGLALGYLSYKKNSIIPGAILHFGVALTMDMMALWQKGVF